LQPCSLLRSGDWRAHALFGGQALKRVTDDAVLSICPVGGGGETSAEIRGVDFFLKEKMWGGAVLDFEDRCGPV
jgi:hypothetical protein